MIPIEALKLALNQELEAIKLYQRLSIKFPVTRDTFTFLVNEEQKHKRLLEKEIYNMTKG